MLITEGHVNSYIRRLYQKERSTATVKKYGAIVRSFVGYTHGRPLTRELVIEWKQSLDTLSPKTVNVYIAAVNGFLSGLGRGELRLTMLKIQEEVYRCDEEDLSYEEFQTLVACALSLRRYRLALALTVLCALGLRVSELRYVTVEGVRQGVLQVANKGKRRKVGLTPQLRREISAYCEKMDLRRGEVFVTRTGGSLARTQLWAEMKWLCSKCGVLSGKVYPHNLRHLFAVRYYDEFKDIAKLGDMLGHSNLSTTRIYIKQTGSEHLRQIESLNLVPVQAFEAAWQAEAERKQRRRRKRKRDEFLTESFFCSQNNRMRV